MAPVITIVTAIIACIICMTQASVPPIEGFKVTWSDDFEGSEGSPPSSDNWIVDEGTSYPGGPANWGTGEIQTYTSNKDNLRLSGAGELVITPVKDSSGQWTSARIETSRKDFVAGTGGKVRFQAHISMPDVSGDEAIGYWPAFWSLGGAYRGNYQNWPSVGEYDIMENVNGIDSVWGVLHCGTSPGGPCKEMDGLPGNLTCPNSPCQGNFHTYTLEIDRSKSPEVMTWSVDDNEYHSVSQDAVGDDNVWNQAIHSEQFMLLNVAIGGAFPNKMYGSNTPVDSTVSGKPMLVDYVAVYNSQG